MIDILVDDDELAALEAVHAQSDGAAPAESIVALAWHLRQRDTARAQRLLDEAQALADARRPETLGRIALVQAEIRLLYADFAHAETSAAEAIALFDQARDSAGRCDTWWLLGRLAADRGDPLARRRALDEAARCATRSGDGRRQRLIEAIAAGHAAFASASEAEAAWGDAMASPTEGHAGFVAWACDFHACLALHRSDHAAAIGWLRSSYEAARGSGQVKKAIAVAANIGLSFERLHDHAGALEYAEQALGLARRAGWPASVGVALMQTAASLERLQHLDAASELVGEAIAVLAPLAGSFNYPMALLRQGELAVLRREFGQALDAFARLEARTAGEDREHFRVSVLLGRARAHAGLGERTTALEQARAALAEAVAAADARFEIEALQLLAEAEDEASAVHRVDRIFEIADARPGLVLAPNLLDFAAERYAAAGDPSRAYALARRAREARDRLHDEHLARRAIAMHVRFETERAEAAVEHHRSLAVAEQARAAALEETLASRERLHAERDRMLAFLAHDLRVPLAAIVTMLPVAEAVPREEPSALRRAARLAARALALTDRFLSMARLGQSSADGRDRIDLGSVADEACETFLRRAFEEGTTLEMDLIFGVFIDGSREALTRALCNLVDNALRHTGRGGRVEVGMRTGSDGDGDGDGDGDAMVEIAVADGGGGIPEEACAVLRGESNRRIAAQGRLGLVIVAEVARAHGARVAVERTPTGSVVRLAFRRLRD